jgi:hypothetical protein
MGSQRADQVLAIKNRVRRRDGNRCVVCQTDQQTHAKRFGKILDVHRVLPRSDYSTDWGVCVTLCGVCDNAIHGKGHWRWIVTDVPVDEQQRACWVRRSSCRDLNEEEKWHNQEAWGAWVKRLRLAKLSMLIPKRKSASPARRRKKVSPIARFAKLSRLPAKTLRDFETGRREPLLSEAKKLSTALGITLIELATAKEPDYGWRKLCEERSHLRALVFRARDSQEGEVEALSPAARLVWAVVGRANEKRAEEREAARRAEEDNRREMLAKRPRIFGSPACPKLVRASRPKKSKARGRT